MNIDLFVVVSLVSGFFFMVVFDMLIKKCVSGLSL